MKFLEPHSIIVTQSFVNHAEAKYLEGGWTKRQNADALLFEWWLENKKYVKEFENWRHDFIYKDMKVDLKEIYGDWFNIHTLEGRSDIPKHLRQTKMDQYHESINMKELTHFLFYRSSRNKDILLKDGDIINIEPFALCTAKEVWYNASHSPSNYVKYEARIHVETLKMIGDINEIILENS